MNPLILLAIQETPNIIEGLRALFARQNPNAPPVTDEEALQALHAAVQSSIAKDDQWLAAHPAKP